MNKIVSFLLALFLVALIAVSCSKDETTGPENSAPYEATNPNPTNNSLNIPLTVLLTWTCSDPENDPLTYDIYFGTSNNPPLVTMGETSCSYNPGTLNEDRTYYWKIKAIDNHDNYSLNEGWSFTTVKNGDNINLIYPKGYETMLYTSPELCTYTITWEDDIIENVKIQLYRNGVFVNDIVSSTSSNGTYTWLMSENHYSTKYKIKIASVNNENVYDISENYFTISCIDADAYWEESNDFDGDGYFSNRVLSSLSLNCNWNEPINIELSLYCKQHDSEDYSFYKDLGSDELPGNTSSYFSKWIGDNLGEFPLNHNTYDFMIKIRDNETNCIINEISKENFPLLGGVKFELQTED